MFKSKRKNFVMLFVGLIFLMSILILIILNTQKRLVASADTCFENTTINNVTLDDDFDDGSVIVVLDKNVSQFNGISNSIKDSLYEIGAKDIKDLTALPNTYLNSKGEISFEKAPNLAEYYSENHFNQILKIELCIKEKQNVLNFINKTINIEGIIDAEPNLIISSGDAVSDDTRLNSQWGLIGSNGINATDAWDITTGSSSVRIGVIDSGINAHVDFESNLLSGYDFYNNNDLTTDNIGGHGTHVAGIIGAYGNNTLGVSGVSQRVSLVPLQTAYDTAGSGNHYTEDIVEAITYARNLWGTEQQISILNYSISQFGVNTTVLSAVQNSPGLFVWSAGNNGDNVDGFSNSAKFNLPNLISVGAIDSSAQRASFSNYGTNSVSIYAPGVSILSTVSTNNYEYWNGTSMAAPHVTGVAALMLSCNPDLPASQLKKLILNSADTITITVPNSSGGTTTQNVKKLNAYKAVKSVDINSNVSLDFSANFIEGDVTETSPKVAPVKQMNVVLDQSVTVTAPNIDGYEFVRWDVKGSTPRHDSDLSTYSKSKTIEIQYGYVKNIKDKHKYVRFYAIYKKPSCIAEGSLITLADGSQKAVEKLSGDEQLLVWNLQTGKFDAAPILFIDKDAKKNYEVIKLNFSDGTTVDVISEHAFWDFDLNKYVFLREDAETYIGHWFNKQIRDDEGKFAYTKVQLIDVHIETRYTTAWSPVTYGHLCYYVNGLLSMPGATESFINIFNVDSETLSYKQDEFINDIETYGLFTYDEFCELIPVSEEIFNAFNGQYLKVAIGKGITNLENLGKLFEQYQDKLTTI